MGAGKQNSGSDCGESKLALSEQRLRQRALLPIPGEAQPLPEKLFLFRRARLRRQSLGNAERTVDRVSLFDRVARRPVVGCYVSVSPRPRSGLQISGCARRTEPVLDATERSSPRPANHLFQLAAVRHYRQSLRPASERTGKRAGRQSDRRVFESADKVGVTHLSL